MSPAGGPQSSDGVIKAIVKSPMTVAVVTDGRVLLVHAHARFTKGLKQIGCAVPLVENTWAASFGGPYRSTYLHRAELFRWLICLSLLVLLILAWKWIRLGLNSVAS